MKEGASPQKEDGFTPIAHTILEALAGIRLSPGLYRLVLAVMRETYGYNEKTRRVRRDRLAGMLGVSKARVRQLLVEAEKRNLVIIDGWKIGFQKDFTRWVETKGSPCAFETGRKPLQNSEKHKEALAHSNRKDTLDPKAQGSPSAQLQRKKERPLQDVPSTSRPFTDTDVPAQQEKEPFIDLYHDILGQLQPGAGRQANIRALPYNTTPEDAVEIRDRWLTLERRAGRETLIRWVMDANTAIGRSATLMGHLKACEERWKLQGAAVAAETAQAEREEQAQTEAEMRRAHYEAQGYIFDE